MITYLAFILVNSFWFAKVEIQIEGPSGWAKNLPTWRIEKHWLLDLFFGGRPMTGYHAWVLSFILLLFHLPCFFEKWTWMLELRVIGGMILFWCFEDFLWFVVNPAFGLLRFRKKFIPWHPRWILGLPLDYWVFLPLGLTLVYSSYATLVSLN